MRAVATFGNRLRFHVGVLSAALVGFALFAPSAEAEIVTYQQGDGKGSVSDTDDTTMSVDVPDTTWVDDGQDITHFEVDLSVERHTVLKFPNIFGDGANQIPLGSLILSATLTVRLDNDGTDCPDIYQLTEGWTEAEATWNSRRTGVSWGDAGADGTTSHKAATEGSLPCLLPLGFKNVDVITSVQNWSNGELNEGWVFVDQGASSNGSNYRSSEHATQADRPQLTVSFLPSVFYSVGTNAGDLKTGSPNITIASGVTTLDVAQTNDIGVGDVIDNGTELVYIWDVVSPTQFRVQTASGGSATDVTNDPVVSIKRAFNSVASAVTSSSNGSHLGTSDLTALGRRLTWVCYDDSFFDVSSTTTIAGYTTDATHFITLSVASSSQVATNNSQRHRGTAGSGVRFEASAGGLDFLAVSEAYTRIEWVEFDGNDISTTQGILLDSAADNSLVRNVILHHLTGATATGSGVFIDTGNVASEVRNSIVYAFDGDGVHVSGTNAIIASSTFYLGRTAPASNSVQTDNGGTATVYNVLAVGPQTDFWENDAPGLSLNNCISTDSSASDFDVSGSFKTGVSPTTEFVSVAGNIDLHLRTGAEAIDFATDLSASFVDDIDDETRPFAAAWDVGADETPFASGATNYRSIGTAVAYGTGTIDVTNLSDIVTGTGTAWVANNRGRGDVITMPCPDAPTCTGGFDYTIFYVVSDNSLRLTETYAGGTASGVTYLIRRQYTTFDAWEDCIDGNPCTFFPVASGSLVADDRSEVGIAYEDSEFDLSADFTIDDSVTDATHTILLTADGVNRHYGTPGAGVVVDGQSLPNEFLIRDSNVTIEWLEFVRVRGDNQAALRILGSGADLPRNVLVQNVLIHDFFDAVLNVSGIRLSGDPGKSITIRNCMIWDGDVRGIEGDDVGDTVTIENCSIDNIQEAAGQGIFTGGSDITVINTIVTRSGSTDFFLGGGSFTAASTNNTDSDGTAPGANPQTVLASDVFVTPGTDLHLKAGVNPAVDSGVDLSFINDIDGDVRPAAAWDRGADERAVATAVVLQSFTAEGVDSAVELTWRTASELDNLGFHLYRSTSIEGPYERITARAIPGLGSSPAGAHYSYRDLGLTNGADYYYELEDIDTTGKTELHGPVSATPVGATSADEPSPDTRSPALITYGDPSRNTFRVLERGRRHVVVELETRGFYAEPREDGTVQLQIPGLELLLEAGTPSIPVKRDWVDAVPGRKVHIASVRALEVETIEGLRPSVSGAAEIDASTDGIVRPAVGESPRGRRSFANSKYWPRSRARVVEVAFQGDSKKVLLELAPVRWRESSGQLQLAGRLVVRLDFRGREPSERTTDGKRWRRYRARPSHDERSVVAQLATRQAGLYAVSYEDVFGERGSLRASRVRLSRQGEAVAFHIEPNRARFAAGSTLFFVSAGETANPYGPDAVYELEVDAAGERMPVGSAAPLGGATSFYWQRVEREENHIYQAGLVDAPDVWLWDALFAPVRKSYPFRVESLSPMPEPAHLTLWLQGASDLPAAVDHHVRVYVNETFVEELSWDGKTARVVEATLAAGSLHEGDNTIAIENVGDTDAAYSMVMLNRFSVRYPRALIAELGKLEGTFPETGVAEIIGLEPGVRLVDVTQKPARWLDGVEQLGSLSRFQAESGRTYQAVSGSQVLRPELRRPLANRLKSERNRADYLVIGPSEFLSAVEPLMNLRMSDGLIVQSVSTESIYSTFGFGETTPQAIQDFLAYAYHRWRTAPRYVLLVGDATYDYKDYLGTGVMNQVPPMMVKTSYLWTASDPAYASVNGEDRLPDIAIGRLAAASKQELRVMVDKLVAYEHGGYGMSGSLVLIADNADAAGEFETAVEELIAGPLAERDVEKIYLSQLGVGRTREQIRDAFDNGASLVSYVGHGGINLWANENIFNSSDVDSLTRHGQQPLLLTFNCLNGYFHFPYFDSLAEKLLKADGKGAVAAFSPSGLSLNGPAHQYHQALMYEIFHGGHERLGDAVLAAQARYATTGAFPELLSIYHLLGDPALRLK